MKIKKRKISSFINEDYKQFAIYTISSRGIPNVIDSLTPVQRMIMLHSPKTFQKTLSVVGEIFKTGRYHHGDQSLANAIQRLAKETQCSENLLVGDGFFGNAINSDAAAPRYTSVKINPSIDPLLKKYNYLNKINELKDEYEPLHTDIPIGLLTLILGISVGYQTKILPRKITDIEKYLLGKKTTLNPYFKNYNGKISNYDNKKSVWLFEGVFDVDEKKKEITIKEIPPILKYQTLLIKLQRVLEPIFDKISFQNNSTDNINITIGLNSHFDEYVDIVKKACQIIFTEQLTFVFGERVIQYNGISEYLDDYKKYKVIIEYKDLIYKQNKIENDIEFLKAKLEFLNYMLGDKRSEQDIEKFLKKYNTYIYSRLDNLKLKNLSKEEIQKTKDEITNNQNNLVTVKENLKTCKPEKVEDIFITKIKNVFTNEDIITDIEIFEMEQEEIDD